jgi:hypothetical protein
MLERCQLISAKFLGRRGGTTANAIAAHSASPT